MEQSEKQWLKSKVGFLSASELHKLHIGKQGGVTKVTKSYISKKRFERKNGYSLYDDNKYFRMGKQYEQDAINWLKENQPDMDIAYSLDEDEFKVPPFYKVDWAKFGVSPDAETREGNIIIDTKVLCTPDTICFFSDETIPYDVKKARVLKEHGDQMKGIMLARPKCNEFWIVKYNPQLDENDLDTKPTTAEYRGFIYKFTKKEFGTSLEETKQMIILADQFIDSSYAPFKYGAACLVEGKMVVNE